jgi:hypothetical protein
MFYVLAVVDIIITVMALGIVVEGLIFLFNVHMYSYRCRCCK